jgi:hypothetical protein
MRCIALLILILFVEFAQSQNFGKDSTNKFVPKHTVVQYAGDMGFLSAGVGYDFFSYRIAMDFMVGYLPQYFGGVELVTGNFKIRYTPYHFKVLNQLYLSPFQFGLFTSYAFGEQYTNLNSDKYPSGYYWWTTDVRFGLFIGQSLMIISKPSSKIIAKEIYYEFTTNDLLLYIYLDNDVIALNEIIYFDCGIKFYF